MSVNNRVNEDERMSIWLDDWMIGLEAVGDIQKADVIDSDGQATCKGRQEKKWAKIKRGKK